MQYLSGSVCRPRSAWPSTSFPSRIAAATAGAYFLADVYPIQWRIEPFSLVMSAAVAPAVAVLDALALRGVVFLDPLKRQHRDPDFGVGRFCRPTAVRTWSYEFWSFILPMFGVYFIDNLGFLRIIETPVYSDVT